MTSNIVETQEQDKGILLFDSEKESRFLVREITEAFLPDEFSRVAFDESYSNAAQKKFRHQVLKIEGLSAPAANILKQTCLTVGAEAAVHRHAIDCKMPTDRAPLLISATEAQLDLIIKKLRPQPFGLKACAEAITRLRLRQKTRHQSVQSVIILNCTPDSFSDGGKFSHIDDALKTVDEALNKGADWFDIGGESTRPGATLVDVETELMRVLPIIQQIKQCYPNIKLSIDTQKAAVAEAAIEAGVKMVNDVSGLVSDPRMVDVLTQNAVKVVLMHMQGTPETMQISPQYTDVIGEITQFFYQQIGKLVDKNYPLSNIILDPGFGFGKTRAHNFEVLKRMSEFVSMGFPVMAGVSRKSFLTSPSLDHNALLPDERDFLTSAAIMHCYNSGVQYYRFHNYQNLLPVIDLIKALES